MSMSVINTYASELKSNCNLKKKKNSLLLDGIENKLEELLKEIEDNRSAEKEEIKFYINDEMK